MVEYVERMDECRVDGCCCCMVEKEKEEKSGREVAL